VSFKAELSPFNNAYSIIVRRLVEEFRQDFNFTRFSGDIVKELCKAYKCNDPAVKELLDVASSEIDEIFRSASRLFDVAFLIDIEAVSRIITHTRSPFIPLEIGIAWHPYLNLPYIPSTTLKGVLRMYVEELNIDVCNISLKSFLGSTEESSNILVSDALPVGCLSTLLQPDVLTPHYREVEGSVSEVQVRPVPLTFPTIAPGTKLRFTVAFKFPEELRNKLKLLEAGFRTPLCLVKELPQLIGVAFELGIGAKTSVGYGAIKISLLNYVTKGEGG